MYNESGTLIYTWRKIEVKEISFIILNNNSSYLLVMNNSDYIIYSLYEGLLITFKFFKFPLNSNVQLSINDSLILKILIDVDSQIIDE